MSSGMSIHHPKARGKWAELRFMLRATELGLRVTKPWGDNSPYDLVIETSGRFLRVQVKCTRFRRGRSYKCHLDSTGTPSTKRAAHLCGSPSSLLAHCRN